MPESSGDASTFAGLEGGSIGRANRYAGSADNPDEIHVRIDTPNTHGPPIAGQVAA